MSGAKRNKNTRNAGSAQEMAPVQILTNLYDQMDEHQKNYAKSMRTTPVTFVDAPSGTGKTTIAVLVAFEFLLKGWVQQILYLRFADDRYLSQGFLPGTEEEKTAKLFFPFFEAMQEIGLQPEQFQYLQQREQIVLTSDLSLRGRNLRNTFLIIDEAQNARTLSDLQLVLSRLHDENSRAVIIGHSGQQDNHKVERTKQQGYTPFQAYMYHMTKKPFAVKADLVTNYRGEISSWADQIGLSLDEL